MNLRIHEEHNPRYLTELVMSLPAPLGVACFTFSVLVMQGYIGGLEFLYRPVSGGEATHPLTAVCIMFLSLGLCLARRARGSSLSHLLTLAGLFLAGVRVSDYLAGTSYADALTPFADVVAAEVGQGLQNSMGINTALMLLFIAVAIELHHLKRPLLSQAAAFISLAIPMISITGYAYSIEEFYGRMSLVTTSIGLPMSFMALFITSDKGALSALLSPHVAGITARIQVLLGYLVPFTLGALVVKSFDQGEYKDLFGLYVVAICWFIILMVSVTAILHESAEHKRRKIEQLLKEAALTDDLTNIPNRRQFMDIARREYNRTQRTHIPVWLLMLDVDHFKKINDTEGHQVGDQVLIELGKVLKSSVRSTDMIGRMGGEEFAVLLTDTTEEGARRVAQVLHANIEAMEVEGWTEVHGRVTASMGVAGSDDAWDLDKLLDNADKALYQSKSAGRNCITFSVPGGFEKISSL